MFNLEQSIADWRRQMLAAGIQTPVPLEELEAHLREDIERRMKSGINAQQACEIAIQEMGKANMLKNEFKKLDRTTKAAGWKRLQLIIVASLGVVSAAITALVLFNPELDSHQRLTGSAAVAVMLLLAGLGQWGHGFFPAILNQRARNVIGISVCALIVLGLAVLAYVVLPQINFTVSQFAVAVVWVLALVTGGLWGFIGGLEKTAMKKPPMAAA
jgi:uncharacterized membrane protein YqjE